MKRGRKEGREGEIERGRERGKEGKREEGKREMLCYTELKKANYCKSLL